MRRLARHLFTLCSAVSLLLCVAVCVLWVRSHFASEYRIYVKVRTSPGAGWWYACWGMHWAEGELMVGAGSESGTKRGLGPSPEWIAQQQSLAGTGWHLLKYDPAVVVEEWMPRVRGFGYLGGPGYTAPGGQGVRFQHMAAAPFWFLFVSSGVLPALWLWQRRPWSARRRLAAGLCPSCGYDLRASPERCPECGTLAGKVNA